jgi:hypothetical protein
LSAYSYISPSRRDAPPDFRHQSGRFSTLRVLRCSPTQKIPASPRIALSPTSGGGFLSLFSFWRLWASTVFIGGSTAPSSNCSLMTLGKGTTYCSPFLVRGLESQQLSRRGLLARFCGDSFPFGNFRLTRHPITEDLFVSLEPVALTGTGAAHAHTMAALLSGCERIVPPSGIATCLSCQEGKNPEGSSARREPGWTTCGQTARARFKRNDARHNC